SRVTGALRIGKCRVEGGDSGRSQDAGGIWLAGGGGPDQGTGPPWSSLRQYLSPASHTSRGKPFSCEEGVAALKLWPFALAVSECRSARHGPAPISFAALRRPGATRPPVSLGACPLHCGPAVPPEPPQPLAVLGFPRRFLAP